MSPDRAVVPRSESSPALRGHLPVPRPDRLPAPFPAPRGTRSTPPTNRATAATSGRDNGLWSSSGTDRDVELGVGWMESRIQLGPDWRAIGGFSLFVVSLVGGAVLGEVAASGTGGMVGAMTAAAMTFTVARVRSLRRLRRLDPTRQPLPVREPVTATADAPAPVVVPVEVWVWRCSPCVLTSTRVGSRSEAHELAAVHDRLHHGQYPCAQLDVRPVAALPSASATASITAPAPAGFVTVDLRAIPVRREES